MPELPEIEVLRRDLEKEVVGRRIKEAEIRPGSGSMKVVPRHGRRKEFQELLVGAKVESVDRIGRLLVLELDNEKILVFDLASKGLLLKTSASDEIASNTHVVISFTIGGQLRFVDPAKTGELYVVPKDELAQLRASVDAVIDPLNHQFTWNHFSALLSEKETPLKKLLMDESFLLGLGDVYSDEVLFVSGLRYDRPSNKLTSQDVRRLYRALMETLQEAVKARGVSWDGEFRDLQGDEGTYLPEIKVFRRAGEACRRCRSEIVVETSDGITSYFCPQCQS